MRTRTSSRYCLRTLDKEQEPFSQNLSFVLFHRCCLLPAALFCLWGLTCGPSRGAGTAGGCRDGDNAGAGGAVGARGRRDGERDWC